MLGSAHTWSSVLQERPSPWRASCLPLRAISLLGLEKVEGGEGGGGRGGPGELWIGLWREVFGAWRPQQKGFGVSASQEPWFWTGTWLSWLPSLSPGLGVTS